MKTKILSALLSAAATAATVAAVTVPVTPAQAIIVFDPSNYAQNVLQAARALQQINQQIRSLQNEATMIVGMTKNLDNLSFSSLARLTGALQQIDQLMGSAKGIGFQLDQLEAKYRSLFPDSFDQATKTDDVVHGATARLQAVMDAFHHTMGIQAQIVENAHDDAQTLSDLVGQSQGSHGALQAQQATNQLLALTAKQQSQLQEMMAAQYRADALARAADVQAETDAQAATRRFLGSGKAYTPR